MSDFLPDNLLNAEGDDEYEVRRLLDEIAAEFPEKTEQRLFAEVRTRYPQAQTVEHDFYLVVSAPRYTYLLFSATHGIDEYPVKIHGPGQGETQSCADTDELQRALREIFSAARTRKLVNQLARSAS